MTHRGLRFHPASSLLLEKDAFVARASIVPFAPPDSGGTERHDLIRSYRAQGAARENGDVYLRVAPCHTELCGYVAEQWMREWLARSVFGRESWGRHPLAFEHPI